MRGPCQNKEGLHLMYQPKGPKVSACRLGTNHWCISSDIPNTTTQMIDKMMLPIRLSCLVKGPIEQNPKYAVFQRMQKFITHAKQKRRKMLVGM